MSHGIKISAWVIAAVMPFCVWSVYGTVQLVQYSIHVGGRLKRAANANTVELAKQELHAALEGIEKRDWTSGSTHIFWYAPSTDVGFWHQNLQASYEELDSLSEGSTPLEKSNMLLKLRETILDEDGDGTYVTAPSGISRHPHNTAFFWSGLGVVLWMLATPVFYGIKEELW